MTHLRDFSTVIFLDIDLETVRKRIQNFDQRGIARAPEQSIEMIFQERFALYKRYCDMQVSSGGDSPAKIVNNIVQTIQYKI